MMRREAALAVSALTWIGASAFAAQDAASRTSLDVHFRSEGALLASTLLIPEGATPDVAIVLVHGSAKEDSLRMSALARALSNDGFAVLTYDKRGVGESEGVFEPADDEATLQLLAKDAVAAVDAAVNIPQLRNASVGLLGISQGGWVGPIAAAHSDRIEFMLLWSGPVCTLSEELHFSALSKRLPDFSMHKYSREIGEHMKSVPQRAHDFDPVPVLRSISVPTLWVFGARDNSIPVELSIERLNGLIKDGQRNFEYRLLPAGGHSLSYPDQVTIDWLRNRGQPRG